MMGIEVFLLLPFPFFSIGEMIRKTPGTLGITAQILWVGWYRLVCYMYIAAVLGYSQFPMEYFGMPKELRWGQLTC